MSLKIKEEVLRVENLVGENSAQAVVQGTVELSAGGGNIGRVVWLKANPVVQEVKVTEDRVIAEGAVDLQLCYVLETLEGGGGEPKTAQFKAAIPFNSFVEVIGAEPAMEAQVKVNVQNTNGVIRPDQRSLDVDVLITLIARVIEKKNHPVVTSASVLAPKKLNVDDLVVRCRATVAELPWREDVSTVLVVPEGYGNLGTILELQVSPGVIQAQIQKNTVMISGDLEVEVLYADPKLVIDRLTWPEKLPFSVEVADNRILPGLSASTNLIVNPRFYIEDGGGKLQVDLELTGTVKLRQDNQFKVILNLASPSGDIIEVRREKVRFDNLVNEKSQQATVQGVIELSEEFPAIREILKVKGKANINDYRIDEDKVYVDGSIDVEATYLAHSEDSKPLHYAVFRNAVPMQQVIAIGGAEPGMHATIEACVKDIRADLINRETIEVIAPVKLTAELTQANEEEVVVEAIEVAPADPNPPSITYVIVQPNDTLWKLAKRYHTAVEAILDSNSWLREKQQKIQTGDKLCIPRRPLVKK